MKKRMNKKAQDLSIGTLILIVLGIIVLVLLILGFSLGWSNLWEKINIFGGSSSISDIVTACNLAVTANSKFSYCQDFKEIKLDGETQYLNCQDSRVQPNLDSSVNCDVEGLTDAKDIAEWQCLKLQQQNKLKANTKVNGFTCTSEFNIDLE
ncbi:hypothetical protein HY450_03905 [Candidatus Pacearchaeota archaeon]|nr:hypothetical protein [Candidatus Pacearchaeota archaeon]